MKSRVGWWGVLFVTAILGLSAGLAIGATSTSPAFSPAHPTTVASPTPAGPAAPAPAAPASVVAASSHIVPRVVFPSIPGYHAPPSWTRSGAPPGAPLPSAPAGSDARSFSQSWAASYGYPGLGSNCYGKWTEQGQWSYSYGCYGHDEPAVNPFSNLPGSGGNVTWNVQLPTDRSPTRNQSDVYAAIWFGMDLYDPYGYDGQCFLEVQLYPDTNGAGVEQAGVWSGFVVAWQIELSTGFEDPCFAAPLTVVGTNASFVMNQGDHLIATMSGWIGSPYGENITIADTTSGAVSFTNLYNSAQHYPLNPAYLENNIEDSLQWSPGADLPVAFSFESGHTYTGPANDTYGGCNSGVPPPNRFDTSSGCGSYDPASWANDTSTPWRIFSVTFFNAHHRQVASQYGFEQDFGGIGWIDRLSGGACAGRDGSAWCSYPWYSYESGIHALSFGASDFAGTTSDFGQYNQYPSYLTANSAGLGFYPVKNFSVPTSPGVSLRIQMNGSGTVYFLNDTIENTTTISGLPTGSYSINAVGTSPDRFVSYSTSAGVALDSARSPWSSFTLTGNASIIASFAPHSPATATIKFVDQGGHGSVGVTPGFIDTPSAVYPSLPFVFTGLKVSTNEVTVHNGGSLTLAPGMYGLQAAPSPGYNFTGWSPSAGVYIFDTTSNYTWCNVTGGNGTITAHYAKSTELATVLLFSIPQTAGTIRLNGTTYSSGASVTLPVGSWPIVAQPGSGATFETWVLFSSGTMTNFTSSSFLQLQNGTTAIAALFSVSPLVTIAHTVGGQVAVSGSIVGTNVSFSGVLSPVVHIEAVPSPGYRFVNWSASPAADLSVNARTQALAVLTVNGSGTLFATFAPSTTNATVTFMALGGTIGFNLLHSFIGTGSIGNLAHGPYDLNETPNVGEMFVGWSTAGLVSVVSHSTKDVLGVWHTSYALWVKGNGSVTATFSMLVVPVTFVAEPDPFVGAVRLSGPHGTFVIHSGATGLIPPGPFNLVLLGNVSHFTRWFSTSNLSITSVTSSPTPITVGGSGAIYAIATFHIGGHAGRANAPTAGTPAGVPIRSGSPRRDA